MQLPCKFCYVVFPFILNAGLAPVITSVRANRAPGEKLANVSIDWTEGRSTLKQGYTFFFRLQTTGNGISAGTDRKSLEQIQVNNDTFSVTLLYSLDPFLKYTVQVARDGRTANNFGPSSQPFEFTLNATSKYRVSYYVCIVVLVCFLRLVTCSHPSLLCMLSAADCIMTDCTLVTCGKCCILCGCMCVHHDQLHDTA